MMTTIYTRDIEKKDNQKTEKINVVFRNNSDLIAHFRKINLKNNLVLNKSFNIFYIYYKNKLVRPDFFSEMEKMFKVQIENNEDIKYKPLFDKYEHSLVFSLNSIEECVARGEIFNKEADFELRKIFEFFNEDITKLEEGISKEKEFLKTEEQKMVAASIANERKILEAIRNLGTETNLRN
jgi:hypothetical protein